MKTPIRFQSRLLVRRSYKPTRNPRRVLSIIFRPGTRMIVNVPIKKIPTAPPNQTDGSITKSE